LDDPMIAGAYVDKMVRGGDGLIYCITNEDDIFTLKNGELAFFRDHTRTGFDGITTIFPDPDDPGRIYVGASGSELYHGFPEDPPEAMEVLDISPLFTVLDIQKIGDRIWICANNGIGVVDADGFHHLSDVPMDNSVTHVMEDYEGNLWFSSARQGVMKLVSNQFQDVFERCGLDRQVVNSTCMYDGRLFIATDTGLIVLDGGRAAEEMPLSSAKTASGSDLGESDLLEMLDGCRIRSVLRDSGGRLWISTWRSWGLLRYDGGAVTAFTEDDGLMSAHVRAVCETEDGSILVANTGGVSVIEGDRVVRNYGKDDGIDNQEILTVAASPDGDIILGSNGGGIYIINEKGIRSIGTDDGLSSEIVMRVKRDRFRDLYWIVTSNSIAYMTGNWRVTTVQKFPYSNNFDLYENSKGDMWVLSSNGLYVVPAEELIANGDIEPVHYGMANGLPCIATSNSYSELTEDGDLYIAGNTGVAKVNIEASLEDISEFRQSVPFVDADGVRIYPNDAGGFDIPAGTKKLTVYAYVYNYSLTDPQVTYRLEGFDQESVTVARSDLDPVIYTNLPGGSYRFEMELTDALGRGSKALSVPIVKAKTMSENIWFFIVIGLFITLFLFTMVRIDFRRQMQEMEEKHREEAERERIVNELQMAGEIQSSMLPQEFPPFPDRKEFDIYAVMDPAREVGGDFYDFFLIDDDHLCLVIADVSGKGIPAALFMMISKVILQSFSAVSQSAADILTRVNESMCANNRVDMFVTVWLGILEISTGRLVTSNAGHEYPVMKRAEGPYKLLKSKHGLALGCMSGVKYREHDVTLLPGDRIFVYTDGVPEATNANNEMFGTDRMIDALNADPDVSPRELLENVHRAVDGFVKDAEQFDDLTMLCIEYNGPAGQAPAEE
ncbi:MAG: SpoIIE family protein phosphatase, partial [Clostridia bacterium]|nr:SpoIIE family protein phosphatase [Clostridia bacterium]